MADVKFATTADVSQAQKQIDQLSKQVSQLGQQLGQVSSDGKKHAKEHSDALAGVGREILGMATGYLSVRTAIGLVNAELQNQIDLRRKAAEATMTEAAAERQFLMNAGVRSEAEREEYLARIRKISQETGVLQRQLYTAGSAVFSAKGDLPAEQAWSALREAARFVPENPEQGKALAVASLDVMRAAGFKEAGPAMGLIASMARLSHVFDWEKIAQHGVRGVAAAIQAGATPQEAVALWSAETYGQTDWQARKTTTSVGQFARQLEAYYPEKDAKIPRDLFGQLMPGAGGVRKGTGMKTFAERLKYLQENRDQAEAFFQVINLEEAAKPSIRELLKLKEPQPGAPGMAKTYESFLKEVPTAAEAKAYYEAQQALISGTEVQKTAQFGRALGAERERMQAGNLRAARAGYIEKEVPEILQQAGQTALAKQITGILASAQSPEAGLDLARARVSAFREAIQPTRFAVMEPFPPSQIEPYPWSPRWRFGKTVTGTEPLPEGSRYATPSEVPPWREGELGAPGGPRALTEFQQKSIEVMDNTNKLIGEQLRLMEETNRKQSAAGAGVTGTHSE